ncbi:MAG TPA: hypothetical protein VEK33_05945 [Terriglobales bacterium]|nr:hypothetical protein [Terriglobales bacterium]
MTCDKYENALLLAAASNAELDAKLARHLECCSTCRMTLRSERELFSRVDRTLRARVNEVPRPGFLAQLRRQFSNELTARAGSDRVWQMAGVASALLLIAMFYPLVNARQSSVQGNLQTPTIKVPQGADKTQSARASEDFGVPSRRHFKPRAVHSAALQEPEVLVPPDERKAFAQFVACVARGDAIARAAVTPAVNKTVSRIMELPLVSSVDMVDLQLGRAPEEEWINQARSSE